MSESPTKKSRMAETSLDQLKAMTVVVADTGDFEGEWDTCYWCGCYFLSKKPNTIVFSLFNLFPLVFRLTFLCDLMCTCCFIPHGLAFTGKWIEYECEKDKVAGQQQPTGVIGPSVTHLTSTDARIYLKFWILGWHRFPYIETSYFNRIRLFRLQLSSVVWDFCMNHRLYALKCVGKLFLSTTLSNSHRGEYGEPWTLGGESGIFPCHFSTLHDNLLNVMYGQVIESDKLDLNSPNLIWTGTDYWDLTLTLMYGHVIEVD